MRLTWTGPLVWIVLAWVGCFTLAYPPSLPPVFYPASPYAAPPPHHKRSPKALRLHGDFTTVRPCGGTLEACSEKTSVKRSAEAARPYGNFEVSYSDWEKKEKAKRSAEPARPYGNFEVSYRDWEKKEKAKRSAEPARPYGDFTVSYSDWEKKEKISTKRSAEDIENNDISDQGNDWSNDECLQTMEKSGIDTKHFPFQTAHRFTYVFKFINVKSFLLPMRILLSSLFSESTH